MWGGTAVPQRERRTGEVPRGAEADGGPEPQLACVVGALRVSRVPSPRPAGTGYAGLFKVAHECAMMRFIPQVGPPNSKLIWCEG